MEGQKGIGKGLNPSTDGCQKAVTPTTTSTPKQTAASLSTTAGSGSSVRSPAAEAAGAKGSSPSFTSPGSETKPRKSVKHLECAYYFGLVEGGCKFSEENCLYAHHKTGHRALPPVTIEPGRPPVAGKNATNPHPEYRNWRNSAHEEGVEISPGLIRSSPHIAARPEVPLPLRQQIDRIHTKAAHSQNLHHPLRPHNQPSQRHFNHSQIGPIPPATPTMGHTSHNVNAQPFSSTFPKVEEANQPGPSMTSPAGSPGMARPVNPANTPINAAASHPGPHMANASMNIADPYCGAHPQPFVQHGAYYLPPPPGPGQQEYEAALQHYRRELEATQQQLATRTAENTALRKELTKTQAERQAAINLVTKLRMVRDTAIDYILTLDYHSEATVIKFYQTFRDEANDTLTVMKELNEIVKGLPHGDLRFFIGRARDLVIIVNKRHIDGMDNALEHHEECSRLRAWFHDYVERAQDEEALDQLGNQVCKSGYRWKKPRDEFLG